MNETPNISRMTGCPTCGYPLAYQYEAGKWVAKCHNCYCCGLGSPQRYDWRLSVRKAESQSFPG